MNRPTGVTIISILFFLGGCILVLLGIGFLVGMSLIGALGRAGSAPGFAAFFMGLGAVAGIFFLIFSVIPFAVGYGLWSLKEWARIVAIVLCAIGMLGGVLGMMLALTHFHIFVLFWLMVRLAINGLIIWYLLQPDVKQVFA